MYWLLLPPTPQEQRQAPAEQQKRPIIDARGVLALLQSLVRFNAVTTLKRRR